MDHNTWLRDRGAVLLLKAIGVFGGLLKKAGQLKLHFENLNILGRLFE